MKKHTLIAIFFCVTPLLYGSETDTHRKAAEELVASSNQKGLFIASFSSFFDPMVEQMAQSGASDEQIRKVKEAGRKFAQDIADDPELTEGFIDIYQAEFTEEELKDLNAFYKTPLGQKTLVKMSTIMQQGSLLGERVAAKHEAEFSQEIMEIMSEK